MILLHLESAKVLGELYLRVRNRLSMSVVAHLVFVYQFQFLFLLQRCQSIEYIFLGTLLVHHRPGAILYRNDRNDV